MSTYDVLFVCAYFHWLINVSAVKSHADFTFWYVYSIIVSVLPLKYKSTKVPNLSTDCVVIVRCFATTCHRIQDDRML